MPNERWTAVADGFELRTRGKPSIKVTKTDGDGSLYNLLEYQKSIGYVWQDRYTKRTLDNWLSANGYPRIP